jgi:hypothetical protein
MTNPALSDMKPDDQIRTITERLMAAVRVQIESLKTSNPEEFTRVLLLDAGARQDAIRTLVAAQIRNHLNPPDAKLNFRVRNAVSANAGSAGEGIMKEVGWELTMQQFAAALEGQGIFGAPSNHLFRNASAPVTPSVVIGNGSFRHRSECGPSDNVIAHVFSASASEILFNYTRDPGTLPFAVVSATTDDDNTLGQSPTWAYAFPRPALNVVPAATIAAYLQNLNATTGGGTVMDAVSRNYPAATPAESVTACLGPLFTLQTDSGALPGALTAFVSTQGAQEHILLNHVAFTAGQDLFRSVSPAPEHPYRSRWKVLSQYAIYKQEVDRRNLPE